MDLGAGWGDGVGSARCQTTICAHGLISFSRTFPGLGVCVSVPLSLSPKLDPVEGCTDLVFRPQVEGAKALGIAE